MDWRPASIVIIMRGKPVHEWMEMIDGIAEAFIARKAIGVFNRCSLNRVWLMIPVSWRIQPKVSEVTMTGKVQGIMKSRRKTFPTLLVKKRSNSRAVTNPHRICRQIVDAVYSNPLRSATKRPLSVP